MNHPWQQPIRPIRYQLMTTEHRDRWSPVLFIRPTDTGWEILGEPGVVWDQSAVRLQLVTE